jgi:hypothetical protein
MSETQDERSTAFGIGGTVPNPLSLGGVVPGVTPGKTPPTFPGNAGGNPSGADPSDAIKKLLSQLMAQSQQRQIAVKPQAPTVPGRMDPTPPGYMQQGPGWGFERFAHTAQANLQNAAAAHKERQIQKAEADWEYMASATQELEAAKAGGNQQAIQKAQGKLFLFLSDGNGKRLKNMSEVFREDWMSPERTKAHGEAYKRFAAKQQMQDQAKNFAWRKMTQFFRHFHGQQQPPMTPEERQSMVREVVEKMPMTPPGGTDPKLMLELQKNIGEEFYKGKELEMRGKEFEQKDRELQENRKQREQDFQQTHQLKIDELNEKSEALDRRRSTEKQASRTAFKIGA